MDEAEQVYVDLRKHLDRMPVNFPATRSGVEIRILKHLFTPEEAEIALQLSMLPEPVQRIHRRVRKSGISIDELRTMLDRMVFKGNIFSTGKGDERQYSNAPLAVGMYEFQVDRQTKELAADWLQYLDEAYAESQFATGISQLRTIPVEKSIPLPEKHMVSQYDDVRKLVENAPGPLAVANCVCRQTKDLVGDSCKQTDLRETCIMLTPEEAEYYQSVGIGRFIDKEEALEILAKAQADGLVLQPINAQQPEALCCCCGDCCGILTSVKKFPDPSSYYASNYHSEVDPALCTGCRLCVDRCRLEAVVMNDGIASINLKRCIGCGNCVVTCKAGAIKLVKKEKETVPPKDMTGLQMKILSKRKGKLNLLKTGIKLMLKQQV
jgi:electron transport complex protein RnfB